MAVEIKTFLDGFDDLQRLCDTRRKLLEAKCKLKTVLVDSSLGSLDDRSILTDEERARFFNLSNALDKAENLLTSKIRDQQEKCVRINVTGFSAEPEDEAEPEKENDYF